MTALCLLLLLYILGRIISWGLYRLCWSHGSMISGERWVTLALLRKGFLWPLHLLVMVPLWGMTWENMPGLHAFALVGCGMLALGAVGRFGSVDRGRFYFLDRGLAVLTVIGVGYSPMFVYPCILVCCSLQYTVAGWRLGPGYSNLLGFEFIRASLAVLLMGITLYGWADLVGVVWVDFEYLTLAVLLTFQASTYVNHALAKSCLGPKWYSWIGENRLECLLVNAWLRGWCHTLSRKTMLRLAVCLQCCRRPVCALVWLLEVGWALVLAGPGFAVALLVATAFFHLVIFILTGLTPIYYIANHLVILWTIVSSKPEALFRWEYLLGALIAISLTGLWVGWLRGNLFREFENKGDPARYGRWADAADHLMGWWDGPLMRMYTYVVTTESGSQHMLPVTKFSPYDTAITDIQTHLMILGLHGDLDPALEEDRAIARTGVWGLLVHREDRDLLYALMDSGRDPECLCSSGSHVPWVLKVATDEPASARPLREFIAGLNQHVHRRWFRWIMRWPHFPGEDLVSDICPLAHDGCRSFAFDEPISKVTVFCVKTYYDGQDVWLIEQRTVGILDIS